MSRVYIESRVGRAVVALAEVQLPLTDVDRRVVVSVFVAAAHEVSAAPPGAKRDSSTLAGSYRKRLSRK